MLQTILSISGKPGLYKLVSRGNNKRQPVFATDRVTSLADIAMFTDSEDVPLGEVLAKVRDKEEGKVSSLNWRKASAKELQAYFAEVLPTFDRDRVHNSDIKKLIQWYNILIQAGVTDFEEEMQPTEGDHIQDRQEQE